MPRKQKERKIGSPSKETMKEAVIEEGNSIRVAAERFDVKVTTLHRYVKKKQQNAEEEIRMEPNYTNTTAAESAEKNSHKGLVTPPPAKLEHEEAVVHTSSDDEQKIKSGNGPKVISDFITPEQIRGFPKAQRRQMTRKPRTRGKSSIITDTLEKNVLLEKELLKRQKLEKPKVPKLLNQFSRKAKTKKTTIVQDTDSTDAEDDDFQYEENSTDELSGIENFDFSDEAHKNDFVLVQFPKNIYYVGKILVDLDENRDYEVSFLRKPKKLGGCSFLFPQVPDISLVKQSDIKYMLPQPLAAADNKGFSSYFRFDINFGSLDVR